MRRRYPKIFINVNNSVLETSIAMTIWFQVSFRESRRGLWVSVSDFDTKFSHYPTWCSASQCDSQLLNRAISCHDPPWAFMFYSESPWPKIFSLWAIETKSTLWRKLGPDTSECFLSNETRNLMTQGHTSRKRYVEKYWSCNSTC